MAIVYRLVKGSPLTFAETDENFRYLLSNMSGSVVAITGSVQIDGSASGSFSGSFEGSVQATPASNIVIKDLGDSANQEIEGSITLSGNLTAEEYIISSSVVHYTESFASGSTRFGDSADDTHQITGSLLVDGDSILDGNVDISGDTDIVGNLTQGNGATATGPNAFSQGTNTNAVGEDSHAEGRDTTATGFASHAEGQQSEADANYSHAEGNSTRTTGLTSHAEGSATVAEGVSAHSEGLYTTASGDQSHAEGGYTTAGPEQFAHAEGFRTTASRYASHTEGYITRALGPYSHAEGAVTFAHGTASHAEGSLTVASASYAHAEGSVTKASGIASHAEGHFTIAEGDYSHTLGSQTLAEGEGAMAYGQRSTASGNYSLAGGYNCTTATKFDLAWGYGNTVTGSNSNEEPSVVFGKNNHLSASAALATGKDNFINKNGSYSIVGGKNHDVDAQSSLIGGFNNKAVKHPSEGSSGVLMVGSYLTSSAGGQTVTGVSNLTNTTAYGVAMPQALFQVGAGQSQPGSNTERLNAFQVGITRLFGFGANYYNIPWIQVPVELCSNAPSKNDLDEPSIVYGVSLSDPPKGAMYYSPTHHKMYVHEGGGTWYSASFGAI